MLFVFLLLVVAAVAFGLARFVGGVSASQAALWTVAAVVLYTLLVL